MSDNYFENQNSVVISERNNIRISGIVSVDSFDELQICATSVSGESIVIDGTLLSVKDVNLDKGVLEAEGNINGVNYYDKNPVKHSRGLKGLFGNK